MTPAHRQGRAARAHSGPFAPIRNFVPRSSQDFASAATDHGASVAAAPNSCNSQVPGTATTGRMPHPGECQIVENAKSWKMPNMMPRPGCCWQILETATCWTLPNPGDCQILENAKSWTLPHPGMTSGIWFILETATNPGECHILEAAKSWRMPSPGGCQILWNAESCLASPRRGKTLGQV